MLGSVLGIVGCWVPGIVYGVLGVLGARYWMLGVVAVAVVDVGGGGGLIVGVPALTHRQNLVDWSRDRPQ